MDTSPAPTLRSLTLLHPVTEVPFLLFPILTPFGTNEDLRQLINKQNKPQETLFISLHRLPVQIPFDLATELQIRQQKKSHSYEFPSSMDFWASTRLFLYS